ncbi:MAG: Hsp33 family molecular chaperone HslO [Desulfobacterales bacterium]|nr:Hsp33 family molecular chaperone HslO [Desulfobacterales bacterium]
MIKKDIFERDIKAQFKAAAKDRLYRFIMADGMMKGAVVHATRMIKEMQANHNLGAVETLVLGQAYIAAALMSSSLKGKNDRLSLSVQCSGPIKGLDVDANVFGEIRGYLKVPRIEVEKAEQVRSLSSLFGAGFITVTKYLEDAKTPYSGQVELAYGSIAEDLAHYYLTSEQIPTGFKLSVAFDENEQVVGAGGVFLQAMPGVDPDQVAQAEALIQSMDSLGQTFADGKKPQAIVEEVFADLDPQMLKDNRIEFFCRCTQERMEGYLKGLAPEDRKDIAENGPFPLELRCHHCNTVYRFTQEAIKELLA